MTEKIFSLYNNAGYMIAGPLGSDNALLLGIVPNKPLDKFEVGELIRASKQTMGFKTETFWVRRDR